MPAEADSAAPTSLSRLGRGGALNLVAAVVQQASLLATTALVARVEGKTGLGQYVLCYALLVLVSLLAQVGLRATATRFVAGGLAEGDGPTVRGVVRFSVMASSAAAVAAALAVALASPLLARALHGADLRTGLLVVAVTIPGLTVRDVMLAAVQGWRTQRAFALVGWVLEPLLRLGLTITLLIAGAGLTGAYLALAVSTWVSTVAAALTLRARLRSLGAHARAAVDRRELLAFSVVSWANSLSATGLIWADTLLLGALATTGDVGVYQVATRIVGLAIFVAAPVDALFAPQFAHLSHVEDRAGLRRVFTSATTWTLRLSLPAFLVLLVFPRPLLSVFGSEFAAGAMVTVVLAVGQLVNAATGPAGSLLNMGGRLRLNLADNVANLVLNVVLNVLLIPVLGMLGAAIAWSLSLVTVNLVKMAQIHHVMRLHPYGPGAARAGLAGSAGLAVGIVTRLTLGDGGLGLVVGIATSAVGYLAVTAWLRLTPDELETVKGLVPGRAGRDRR